MTGPITINLLKECESLLSVFQEVVLTDDCEALGVFIGNYPIVGTVILSYRPAAQTAIISPTKPGAPELKLYDVTLADIGCPATYLAANLAEELRRVASEISPN